MDGVNVNQLGYVVNAVLMKLQLPKGRYFEKFLQLAINGYREMNLVGVMPTIKAKHIQINPLTNSADLPTDYIDYLRIGVYCNGYFINYDLNDEIALSGASSGVQCPCDSTSIETTICKICDSQQGFDNWYWPNLNEYGIPSPLGGNFGVGPGFYHGGYRINKELRTIQFDTCVSPTSFVLEYKSSGIGNDGNAYIPEDAIPTLIAYMDWQRNALEYERTGKYNHRDLSTTYKREFSYRLSEFNQRLEGLNKYEYLRIFRRYCYQQVRA